MIKRTHRRVAIVAGVAMSMGLAAPAMANVFVGTQNGAGLNVDPGAVSAILNVATLPNDLAPNLSLLDGTVRNGLVDGILDRLIGGGDLLSEVVGPQDVLTELTGTAPLVQAPLVAPFPTSASVLTGPLVGPTTIGGLLAVPGSLVTPAVLTSILGAIPLF